MAPGGKGGTADIIHKFRQVFKHYDSDSDGFLQPSDVNRIMAAASSAEPPSLSDVEAWFEEHGKIRVVGDRSIRCVSFEEFLALVAARLDQYMGVEPTPREIFEVFDKDETGTVNREELMAVFADLGVSVTDEEVTAMIEEADDDLSGEIGFEEFKRICAAVEEAKRKA